MGQAHRTMTPEEYAALNIQGWHLVHKNYDGAGGVGIRMLTDGVLPLHDDRTTQVRDGLAAAIRAAKLALFVINKAGVMPNSSWEGGFEGDLAKAEATLAAMPNNWRLIETAPKDEKLVLGWWRRWPHDRVTWEVTVDLAGNTKGGWLHGQATHWQPLPDAPALIAEDHGGK